MRGNLKSYRQFSIQSEITVASPHRVIQMMLTGGLERLIEIRTAIEEKNMEKKGLAINKAIGIINGLSNSLNMELGGQISTNLYELYQFMVINLSNANLNNDIDTINDVIYILKNIKEGWDKIPFEQHYLSEASQVG